MVVGRQIIPACRGLRRTIAARRHPLVHRVQALSLLERSDLVVGREALEGASQGDLSAGEGAQREGASGSQALQLEY